MHCLQIILEALKKPQSTPGGGSHQQFQAGILRFKKCASPSARAICFPAEQPFRSVVSEVGEGYCRVVRPTGRGFLHNSEAKHTTHTSPKWQVLIFRAAVTAGTKHPAPFPGAGTLTWDPRIQAVPPDLPCDRLSNRSGSWAPHRMFRCPAWALRPGPTALPGAPEGASERGLTPGPGSLPPSRVRGRGRGAAPALSCPAL